MNEVTMNLICTHISIKMEPGDPVVRLASRETSRQTRLSGVMSCVSGRSCLTLNKHSEDVSLLHIMETEWRPRRAIEHQENQLMANSDVKPEAMHSARTRSEEEASRTVGLSLCDARHPSLSVTVTSSSYLSPSLSILSRLWRPDVWRGEEQTRQMQPAGSVNTILWDQVVCLCRPTCSLLIVL